MRATDHLQMIQSTVDQIHSRHNISIDVAFVKDRTLMRLYHREAEETLTYRLPDITQNCLHNTALGKAYLSSLTDDQLAGKIDSLVLVAKTEKTITDKNALAKELQKTRTRRYAISAEEYLAGLISIGAPLLDPFSGGGIGAVSFDFSVLQHSARKIETRYGDLVVETAKALSELLPPNQGLG
jgi:DNA-binding IclR family transcriptional regulator